MYLIVRIFYLVQNIVEEWNKEETNTNKVEGMIRVGDLAKGVSLVYSPWISKTCNFIPCTIFQLLLATDRSVSAVILCKSAPTKPMLAQLHVDARSRIKELDSNYDTL